MNTSPSRLAESAAALGVALAESQAQQLERLAALLAEGARAFNLTAVTDPPEIEQKHLLDSLSVLVALPANTRRLIDVGTGAGFPGIPLKIARPEVEVTLLEATGKKVVWLNETILALGLRGVSAVAGRAEEVGHDPQHRERYDVSVARAVAPLGVLCELCLPFVKVGGRFIAQKSATGAEAEGPAAARALELVGGRLLEVVPVRHAALPNRVLVVVEKVRETSAAYPRRPGMPTKRPL